MKALILQRRIKGRGITQMDNQAKRLGIIVFLGLLLSCIIVPTLSAQVKTNKAEEVELYFSVKGGYYNQALDLHLSTTGSRIYYTTDGSLPNKRSKVYNQPISIDSTMVIRAYAVRDTSRTKVKAHSYFIDEPFSLTFPTISLAVNPDLLFDPNKGLFLAGPAAVDSLYAMPGANFWSRKEILIHTELFDEEGKCVFNSENGLRLFGGMSRLFPQKSLAVVARNRYGKSRIRHRVFGSDGLKSFKYLVLRNSGSDWGKSHFRDGLMTSLVEHWDIEQQDFKPAHVYINGTYWGIYNMREKINKFFIEDHSGIDKEEVDLIEHYLSLKKGSTLHYLQMLNFLENNNLKIPDNYKYIQELMEVDNFLQYQIAQIYFDNQDAGGNIKFWRPRTPGGRWRWILFDTDWGFGLHEADAYKNNSLAFHTEANGPKWPNPPWSTFILRSLLENPEFEKDFVNAFADHLNSSFHPQTVKKKIESLYQLYLPEIDRHINRWNLSRTTWEREINTLRTFAQKRPDYLWHFLQERFDTGFKRHVRIEASSGGKIILNKKVSIEGEVFEGRYFENYPIRVKAVPNYGYRFSHWEGIPLDDAVQEFELKLQQDFYMIKAVFVPYIHPLAGEIIINEISPKSGAAGDWVELYNKGEEPAFLGNWILTDSKNEFQLPKIVLDAKEYLIICQDSARFIQAHPKTYNVIGGMPFGLNKVQETIGLYANMSAMVDSVSFELEPLDSAFSLNLLMPGLDNGDEDNWIIRFGEGSPGRANPYYIQSKIRKQQQFWLQAGAIIALFLMLSFFLNMKRKGIL